MAEFRVQPCKNYICEGECRYGKDAEHKGLCQRCTRYIPRSKEKGQNRKKKYEGIRREKERLAIIKEVQAYSSNN